MRQPTWADDVLFMVEDYAGGGAGRLVLSHFHQTGLYHATLGAIPRWVLPIWFWAAIPRF